MEAKPRGPLTWLAARTGRFRMVAVLLGAPVLYVLSIPIAYHGDMRGWIPMNRTAARIYFAPWNFVASCAPEPVERWLQSKYAFVLLPEFGQEKGDRPR